MALTNSLLAYNVSLYYTRHGVPDSSRLQAAAYSGLTKAWSPAGRDVATGTYRVVAVQMAFSKAARRLEDLAQSRRGSKVNYLEGLFDVRKALDRQAAANGRPPWDRPGKAVNEEYFVIGHGNRYVVSVLWKD